MPSPGHPTDAELVQAFTDAFGALRDRGVIRTNNMPTGDIAESLVAAKFGVELA